MFYRTDTKYVVQGFWEVEQSRIILPNLYFEPRLNVPQTLRSFINNGQSQATTHFQMMMDTIKTFQNLIILFRIDPCTTVFNLNTGKIFIVAIYRNIDNTLIGVYLIALSIRLNIIECTVDSRLCISTMSLRSNPRSISFASTN